MSQIKQSRMMITLNCGWGVPGEAVVHNKYDVQRSIRSLNAAFGIEWKPDWSANDNLPEYLSVVI